MANNPVSILNGYKDNPLTIKGREDLEAIASALDQLEDADQRREYLDVFQRYSQVSAYLLERDSQAALAQLQSRAGQISNPGAGGSGVREGVRLEGLSRPVQPAAEEKVPEVPAVYTVALRHAESNEIVLFEGDEKREVHFVFENTASARAANAVLQDLRMARNGSEEYAKKPPQNKIETALEALTDLLAAYEKKPNQELGRAITKVLDLVTVSSEFLDGSPPERYTTRRDLIIGYYKAGALDGSTPVTSFKTPLMLAQAVSRGKKISIQFAGNSTDYMADLEYLYAMPDVAPLITRLAKALQRRAETDPECLASGFYSQGMDLIDWLKNPSNRPNASTMSSSFISQPLIFVTQAARWLYLQNRGFNPTPEMIQEMGGFSQGVMTATLAAQFLEGEAYASKAEQYAVWLFWQGFTMQEVIEGLQDISPPEMRSAGIDADVIPSPMVAINGLTTEELQAYLDKVNKTLPENKWIYISLNNTYRRKVVSGPVSSLARLHKLLMTTATKEKELSDKKKLQWGPLSAEDMWLSTSAPFHSPYMRPMKAKFEAKLDLEGITVEASALKVTVRNTRDGSDLRLSQNPRRDLVQNQSTDGLNYRAVNAGMEGSIVVDVGPAEGVAGIARSNLNGTGTAFVEGGKAEGLKCLFTTDSGELPKALDYNANRSRVVMLPDGSLAIDNRYTRYIHRPPVRVGGMTPTTGDSDIVVVVTNYGYSIELAGGAQGTDKILEAKIREISERLKPGEYITVNLLFLSSYIWGFLPTVKRLVAEGYPIGGLTIAAGVPDADVTTTQLLKDLNDILIWDVSLKPGEPAGTARVIEIAKQNPDREFVVQFELGPAGGHHSWETADILRENYRKFREQPNIILLVGGGVRNQEDAAQYLDGSWNSEGAPMPMDGVFLGTRMMTATEAKTSPQVKKRLAESTGVPMSTFPRRGAYGEVSDVETATASDGEPIHHTNTTAMRVLKWLEANAKADSPADEPRVEAWLTRHKKQLIVALNGTQKPYFVNIDPTYQKTELTDMNYEQVLHRLVELMFVPDEGGWIDFSLRDFVGRYMEYLESKYIRPDAQGNLPPSFFQNVETWEPNTKPPLRYFHDLESDPLGTIARFFEKYPSVCTILMDERDVAKFVELSAMGRFRMKPLPFIYKIDKNIWRDFASDALWQSQSPRFDADQVLPEPGPVAVAGIPEPNEPAGQILDVFATAIRNRLLISQLGLDPENEEVREVETRKPAAESYKIFREAMNAHPAKIVDVVTLEENPGGVSRFSVRFYLLTDEQRAAIPRVAYLGGPVLQNKMPKLTSMRAKTSSDGIETWMVTHAEAALNPTQSGKGPSEYAQFLYYLAGTDAGTLTTLLTANQFYQGKTPVNNYLRDVLRPRDGQRWKIWLDEEGRVVSIALYDATYLWAKSPGTEDHLPVVEMSLNGDHAIEGNFKVTVRHPEPTFSREAAQNVHELVYYYNDSSGQGYAPIHEVMAGRAQRIKDFYRGLMFEGELSGLGIETPFTNTYTVTDADIRQMFRAVNNDPKASPQKGADGRLRAPLNVGIKVIWESFFKTLFPEEIDADIFKLLHQSAGLEMLTSDTYFYSGDSFDVSIAINEIENTVGGKRIRVSGTVTRNGEPVAKTAQEVFIRGNYSREELSLYRRETVTETVKLESEADVQTLLKRSWFKPAEGIQIKKGDTLSFKVDVNHRFFRDGTKSFNTTGGVYRGDEQVGTISLVYPELTVTGDKRERQKTLTKKFTRSDIVLDYLSGRALSKAPVKLTQTPDAIEVKTTAPKNMIAYALASGDLNPIHTSPYIAAVAGLNEPIVHGMWTYSEAVRILTQKVADGNPSRVVGLNNARFLAPVGLGSALVYSLTHTANRDGNLVYTVKASKNVTNATGEEEQVQVFEAEAVISPQRTIDIFTGQGSARTGMFDDWKDSKPAQAVMDDVDQYLRRQHGFSIKEIVATGGLINKGSSDPEYYVYVDQGERLVAPAGKTILDLTQFQQVALVVYAMAGYTAMKDAGVVSGREIVAGHSLGEYAALSSLGIIPLETVAELVYQRGKTMQDVLSTPEFKGRDYRMASVRADYFMVPADNGNGALRAMTEEDLQRAVHAVMEESREFISVVNCNAVDQAYAVAGTREGIRALERYFSRFDKARGKEKEKGISELPGILVPFHSALLLPGVNRFRQTLQAEMPHELDPQVLEGHYIPNLIAVPFSISREYIQQVYDYTVTITQRYSRFLGGHDFSSLVLKDILDNYDAWAQRPKELTRALVIELLAYQFASPVKWIKTQDTFLHGVEGFEPVSRVREIGPAPHLSAMLGMQQRKRPPFVLPEAASVATPEGRALILANEPFPQGDKKDAGVAKPTTSTSVQAVNEAPKPVAAVAPQAVVAPVPVPAAAPVVAGNVPPLVAGAAKALDETPALSIENALLAVIALKIKKPYSAISLDANIDQLVGGNSTLGNQTVGDLKEEFNLGDDISNPKQIPLSQLIAAIKVSYKSPGPILRNAFEEYVVKPLGKKGMDRRTVLDFLMGERMLPERRMMDVQNWLTVLGREGFFAEGDDPRARLNEAVNQYATAKNLAIPMKSLLDAAKGGGGGAGVSSEALEKFEKMYFGEDGRIARALLQNLGVMGVRWQDWVRWEDSELAELRAFKAQFGAKHVQEYGKRTVAVFDADKIIELERNWADQLAHELYTEMLAGKIPTDDKMDVAISRILRWVTHNDFLVILNLRQEVEKNSLFPNREKALALFDRLLDDSLAVIEGTKSRGYVPMKRPMAPKTEITPQEEAKFATQPRVLKDGKLVATWADFADEIAGTYERYQAGQFLAPFASVRNLPTNDNGKAIRAEQTRIYLEALRYNATNGFDFTGKTIWLSGAGSLSMAEELAAMFIGGGADRVVISHFDPRKPTPQDDLDRYNEIRKMNGRFGNKVSIVPMNQGSKADIDAVAAWMDERDIVPDLVVPFGAVPPRNTLDSDSQGVIEAIEALMLHSYGWMLAASAKLIDKRHLDKKVVGLLPLSPNHWIFGKDKPYGETKRAAETLYNAINSEELGKYIAIAGARIGWVNTALMMDLASLSEVLEQRYGVRTFLPVEMAFQLATVAYLSLLSPEEKKAKGWENWDPTVFMDLNGAFEILESYVSTRTDRKGVAALVEDLRSELATEVEIQKALYTIAQAEKKAYGEKTDDELKAEAAARKQDVRADFRRYLDRMPPKATDAQLQNLAQRRGITDTSLDLDNTFVIVGFGEVGPWGNSRIRWEYETKGELGVEASIELARIMGLIEWRESKDYVGWWDVKEDKAIADLEVKEKYHKYMIENAGIREVDPEVAGFDPRRITTYVEKQVGPEGAEESVANREEAEAIKSQYLKDGFVDGNKPGVSDEDKPKSVFSYEHSGQWFVHLPANSEKRIKKMLSLDRWVAGLLPKGWSARTFGVPESLIEKVDPTSLYNLVSTVEALFSAGMTHFFDILQVLDDNALLTFSSPGELDAKAEVFARTYFGLADIGNVQGGGMGGMSAMRRLQIDFRLGRPEQIDALEDTLINVMKSLATQYIFKGYGATNSTVTACETALASLETGLDLLRQKKARFVAVGGYDDYGEEGTRGFQNMGATAPTQEMLDMGIDAKGHARAASPRRRGFIEAQGAATSLMMSARDALERGYAIQAVVAGAWSASDGGEKSVPAPGQGLLRVFEGGSGSIIAGALATLGLTVNDIDVWYPHGTSTDANDRNELKWGHYGLTAAGRTAGNKVVVSYQKNKTGHPKGPAAGWQTNGVIQALNSGTVPGNPNLDDIDPEFAKLGLLDRFLLSTETLNYGAHALMAGMATSFGFGHEGGVVLLVNPDRVLMALTPEQLTAYYARRDARQNAVYQRELSWLTGKTGQPGEEGKTPYYDYNADKPFEGETEDEIKANERDYLLDRTQFEWDPVRKLFVRKEKNGKKPTGGQVIDLRTALTAARAGKKDGMGAGLTPASSGTAPSGTGSSAPQAEPPASSSEPDNTTPRGSATSFEIGDNVTHIPTAQMQAHLAMEDANTTLYEENLVPQPVAETDSAEVEDQGPVVDLNEAGNDRSAPEKEDASRPLDRMARLTAQHRIGRVAGRTSTGIALRVIR